MPDFSFEHQTLRLLDHINDRLERIMTVQDDINTAAQTITTITAGIATAVSDIEAALAAALAANPGVDLTELQTAVSALSGEAATIEAEDPTPPASA